MSFNIIIGPARSGKKQKLFELFIDNLDKKPILLVPTRSDIVSIRNELLQQKNVIFGAEITTFNQFLKRLAFKAGITNIVINRTQKELIIKKVISNTKFTALAQSAETIGFSAAILSLVTELLEGLNHPDKIKQVFSDWDNKYRSKEYLDDISNLYKGYFDYMLKHELLDEQLLRWEIINALENAEVLENRPIFIYGFDDFTTSQRKILELLSITTNITFAITFEDNDAFAERKTQIDEMLSTANNVIYSNINNEIDVQTINAHSNKQQANKTDKDIASPNYKTSIAEALTKKLPKSINYMATAGDRFEIELIGAKILEFIRSGKYKPDDIAILLRKPNKYAKILPQVFDDFNIPYSFNEPIAFIKAAAGRAIVLLLDFLFVSYNISKFFTFLRIMNPNDQDLIDNFEQKIKRSARLVNDCSKAKQLISDWCEIKESKNLQYLLRLDIFAGDDNLNIENSKLPTLFILISMICKEILHNILTSNLIANDNRKNINNIDLELSFDERLNIEAYTSLNSLLENIYSLLLLDKDLDININDLISIISNLKISVGQEAEPGTVHVLQIYRSRGRTYKVAFIPGLNEGIFPQAASDDPFFNLDERLQLTEQGIEVTARQNNISEERYLFYIAVTRAIEQLYLSYQTVDSDNNKQLKSSLVIDFEKEVNQFNQSTKKPVKFIQSDITRPLSEVVLNNKSVPIPTKKEVLRFLASTFNDFDFIKSKKLAETNNEFLSEQFLTLKQAAKKSLSPEPEFIDPSTKANFADKESFSLTEIQSYVKCPFRWFIEHVLKPQPLEASLDRLNMGTIMHATLETFYKELPAVLGIKYPDKDNLEKCKQLIIEVFEEIFNELAIEKESNDAIFAKNLMQIKLVKFIKDETLRASNFLPEYLEMPLILTINDINQSDIDSTFSSENITKSDMLQLAMFDKESKESARSVKLSLKLDRVDLNSNGQALIVDYKLRSVASLSDIQKANDIQLAIYMAAAQSQLGLDIVGGKYLSILKETSSGIINNDVIPNDFDILIPKKSYINEGSIAAIIQKARCKAFIAANNIRAGFYQPSEDENSCNYCDYSHICRKERA